MCGVGWQSDRCFRRHLPSASRKIDGHGHGEIGAPARGCTCIMSLFFGTGRVRTLLSLIGGNGPEDQMGLLLSASGTSHVSIEQPLF